MEISPVEISLSDLQTQTVGSEKTREHPDDPQETGSVASGLSKSDEAACSKKLASMKSVEMKCETEQIVQLGKDSEAAQASETGLSSSSSSSDETVCRICQGSNKDTEEPIQTTRCACKGAIANIHQSCLREWVRHQRSVRCEICRGRFAGISPPGSLERIVERRLGNVMPAEDITESVHQLYYHISRLQPFTRRRRAAIAASIVFLSMVTCMSAIMTVKADRDYRQVSRDPWSTHHDIDQSGLFLSICVASASFSGTLTIGVVLIWIGVELSAFLQRRAVYRRVERRVLQRMNRPDDTIHQLYFHLNRLRPFSRRRRAAIAASIVFLSLVTCMCAIMTVEADREYRQISTNPWSTHHAIDQSGIVFSVCVASAFFCATLTIGLLVIWCGVECTYHMQRRALYRRVERTVLESMRRHNVVNIL